MIRAINFVLVLTSITALVGVYVLKFAVEDTAVRRSGLQSKIERQVAELSLLKADWALLNQPGHIAPIVVRHAAALGLEPVKQTQFGTFAQIPMRPVPAEPDVDALDSLFQSLDAGIDPDDLFLGDE